MVTYAFYTGFHTYEVKSPPHILRVPCHSTSSTCLPTCGKYSLVALQFVTDLFIPSYRTSNLLLSGIMPGPKEQDFDEVQRFLRIFVNELLRLWQDGFCVPTPSCPEGRRVRVILAGVCCDKPAAHKLGCFGSHSHTYFCTCCWIKQSDKASPEAFKFDG